MSIYIGKGNIVRALQFKRDFQILKTYKRIKEKMIIEKKILHIYRTKKNTSINLSKAVDNIILSESRLISNEVPIFNKKDNGLFSSDKSLYFSEIKNILKESKSSFSIKRFKMENIVNPNNILGILEEKEVFDSNFSKENFFLEFITPYKKLKTTHKIIYGGEVL